MDFVKLLSNEAVLQSIALVGLVGSRRQALPTYCATEELAHLVPNIQQLINAHKEQKEQAPGDLGMYGMSPCDLTTKASTCLSQSWTKRRTKIQGRELGTNPTVTNDWYK